MRWLLAVVLALVGQLNVGSPAGAIGMTGHLVEGAVASADGPLNAGQVFFYEDCTAARQGDNSGYADITAGRYRLTLPHGNYVVRIVTDTSGVLRQSWNHDAESCDQATPVVVNGGSALDLTAYDGSVVAGSVTMGGQAYGGFVHFYASCQDYEDGIVAGSASSSNGRYSVTLVDGTYRVEVGGRYRWHGGATSCAQATPVTVSGDTTVDLSVAPLRTVTGAVRGGSPSLGGWLQWFPTCADYEAYDHWTNDTAIDEVQFYNSQYTANVPDGTYRVRSAGLYSGNGAQESWNGGALTCADSTPVTVSGNGTVDLTLLSGSNVNGTITVNGASGGGSVHFYKTCQDAAAGHAAASANAGVGHYTITIANGSYKVLVAPAMGGGGTGPAWWNSGKTSCADADWVSVTGDTTINLTSPPLRTVTGTVVNTQGDPGGHFVRFLSSCPSTGQSVYSQVDYAGAVINNGTYTALVADGTYRVAIDDSWHSGRTDCATADPMTINSDRTLNLVSRAAPVPAMSTVTGSVTSSAGPVGSGVVYFAKDCTSYEAEEDDPGSPDDSRFLIDIDAGRYSAQIVNGTYRVRILPEAGTGAVRSWHDAQARCADAPLVSVSGNMTLDLEALADAARSPQPPGPLTPPQTTPTDPPTASPAPASVVVSQPVAQTAKAPNSRVRRGKWLALPRSTSQGASLSWKSLSKKTCKVSGTRVKGLRKGTCKLRAAAPAVTGFAQYRTTFTVKVK